MDEQKEIFDAYVAQYNNVLSRMGYPAKNSTGFTERNLSVNFSKVYEKKNPEAVSWFEFQWGENNDEHIDMVLKDVGSRTMFIVEAKRFSSPSDKIASIARDIKRIPKFIEELHSLERFDVLEGADCIYGMILADVWVKKSGRTGTKKRILKSFLDGTFLVDFRKELGLEENELPVNPLYETRRVKDVSSVEDYYLLAMMWRVK